MRFILILSILLLIPHAVSAKDIHVPKDYPTIQQAIDAAMDGDRVLVAPATYHENINYKGKAVTLKSEEGPAVTIIDGNRLGSVVTINNGETLTSVLDGFTITNGYESFGNGGGIYCALQSSPTITNCVLAYNEAVALGGGMVCHGLCSPKITKCTFIGNIARGYPEGAQGGGLSCMLLSNATVTDCLFIGNEARDGGGIDCSGSFVRITNCLFLQNRADNVGGAVFCSGCDPTITNCTMVENSAASGGALVLAGLYLPSYPVLTNCIMWDNDPNEIKVFIGKPTITYSAVTGGWPGVGNIDEDPFFVDPAGGDIHLTYPSPCRNAGNNSAVPPSVREDFEGDLRIADGTVDMGCDEFHTHLYYTGDASPGKIVEVKLVGLPGTAPVGLCVGSGVLDPPLPSAWGDWYLAFPITGPVDLGAIPSPDGILIISGAIPATPPAPYDLPLQALVGDELTNLTVVEVR